MKKYFKLGKTAKGKSLTVFCMALIIGSLYMMSYFLFLRTIDVDVTKDASIVYRGETGSASVKTDNISRNYNQRIQEFMDSIYYETTPQNGISNGDTITIKAIYDSELARRYNIHPIQITRKIEVKDLPVRFEKVDKIPEEYFETMDKQGKNYIKNNMESILAEDFTTFTLDSKTTLQESKIVYRTFLDARTSDSKDKVIDVYAITAQGDVKTANEEDAIEKKTETIYYIVTYNEINTSLQILDENVYGEKVITSDEYDLTSSEEFQKYMNTKYASTYELSFLDVNKE